MSIIPATWEEAVGQSWFKASPGKSERFYLKNKLKTIGLEQWLK
jgi:hypothetical protein